MRRQDYPSEVTVDEGAPVAPDLADTKTLCNALNCLPQVCNKGLRRINANVFESLVPGLRELLRVEPVRNFEESLQQNA
jgi:hypothetical protein